MPGPAALNPFDDVPDDDPATGSSLAAADPVVVAGALGRHRLVRDLLPGARPPTFAFDHLTRRPDQVGLTRARLRELVPPGSPVGPLDAPDAVPPVTDAVTDDPLVALGGAGIRVLGAYRGEGWPHTVEGAYLRRSVVDRLGRVAAALPDPFGLAVFDAWRPLALQAALYDTAYADPDLPPGFVAEAIDDPRTPPAHLTGGTVDLTLSHDGMPLALGTAFDDFTATAHADHFEDPAPAAEHLLVVRDLRRLLVAAMAAEGFVVLHNEWWHFEHGTRYWAAVTGATPRFGPASLPD